MYLPTPMKTVFLGILTSSCRIFLLMGDKYKENELAFLRVSLFNSVNQEQTKKTAVGKRLYFLSRK